MSISPDLQAPVLAVRNVSMVFPGQDGGLQVLQNISFRVNSGQFFAMLGPSGCGKSTLLRLAAGLLLPTSGEMTYQGSPIYGPTPDTGIVFQKSNLMPWRTVRENILLPLELQGLSGQPAEERVQRLIELVGLQGFEDTLPRDLSGGMAQRVAIARALIHDPRLLLLDEPFGSLDALTREYMGLELLRIWQTQRITAILVTHSISEALLLSDRVLVFSPRPGRILLELEVNLPRPRHPDMRYMEEFVQLARQLRGMLTSNNFLPNPQGAW